MAKRGALELGEVPPRQPKLGRRILDLLLARAAHDKGHPPFVRLLRRLGQRRVRIFDGIAREMDLAARAARHAAAAAAQPTRASQSAKAAVHAGLPHRLGQPAVPARRVELGGPFGE